VLGDHEGFPVEALAGSADGRLLASIAHDERARFWDTALFAEDVAEAEREREEGEEEVVDDKEDGGQRGDVGLGFGHSEEEYGNEEDDEEDINEVSDDEEEVEEDDVAGDEVEMQESDESDSEPSQKGARKRLPTNSERFFADL